MLSELRKWLSLAHFFLIPLPAISFPPASRDCDLLILGRGGGFSFSLDSRSRFGVGSRVALSVLKDLLVLLLGLEESVLELVGIYNLSVTYSFTSNLPVLTV